MIKRSKPVSEQIKHTPSWGTLYDYINWRGDLSIKSCPFNAIDGLILSILSFINIDFPKDGNTITIKDSITPLNINPNSKEVKKMYPFKRNTHIFAKNLINCDRFKDIEILDFTAISIEEIEEQFAAMTFKLPDNTIFIAFRGTDDTIMGWKENFNLAFLSGTSSQNEATNYANRMIKTHKGKVRIGGHSKGANLAVWAGANLNSSAKKRLINIYNFDGPGFLPEFIGSEKYISVEDRIISIIPDSSLIGILLVTDKGLTIRSNNPAIISHDPFSWRILGKRFDYVLDRTKTGKVLDTGVNSFLSSMTIEERELYVEQIFKVFEKEKIKSTYDFKKNTLHHLLFTIPKLIIAGTSPQSLRDKKPVKHNKEKSI